jgi:hypothetical protein
VHLVTGELVWEETLDSEQYKASVSRAEQDPYTGWLWVYDIVGNLLHKERVSLAYAAQFGPDVDDVHTWMQRVVEVVDDPTKRSEGPY